MTMNSIADGSDVIVRYEESDAVNLFAQFARLRVEEYREEIELLLRDIGPCGALSFLDHRRQCLRHSGVSPSGADLARRELQNYLGLIRERKIINPYRVRSPLIVSSREVFDELECSVSPKVDRLLEVLQTSQEWGGNLRCVIFANDDSSVIALATILRTLSQQLPEHFQFLRPGFALSSGISRSAAELGGDSSVDDEDHGGDVAGLEDFRLGKLNVLVMSPRLHKGYVVPPSNLIVQMDEFRDLEQHARFRSRVKTRSTAYVILTSEANSIQVEDGMRILKMTERIMAHVSHESGRGIEALHSCSDDAENSSVLTFPSAEDSLDRLCAMIRVDESPKQAKGNGSPEQHQDQARLFLAVRVCKRLFESDEIINYSFSPKRRKAEADHSAVDAAQIEIQKMFGESPIASNSCIECKRAMSLPLETAKRPGLPARGTIYVFRTRLDAPLPEEYVNYRTFRPQEEELCFGVLTFFPDCPPNIPEFPIFTRNGREAVEVETVEDLILTEQFWSMCIQFHAYVLKKVCRLPHRDYDPSVAPVIVPMRGKAIDSVVLERVALKRRPDICLNSVVSHKENGIESSVFIQKIFPVDGDTKLCIERLPRNFDFAKNSLKDKPKSKQSCNRPDVNYARSIESFEIEFLSASQWSKAWTIPICIHRLNRLLVAEQYRRDIVQAGIGRNVERWPPMVETDRLPRIVPSKSNITSQELQIMKEKRNSSGPSSADILAALTPSSAQDAVDSERYEMLGDSFLKMAVTLHLFSKKELRDEGELTAERSHLTSNKELFLLAVPKRIHEAVESQRFSVAETFRAPGMILTTSEEEKKYHLQKYRCKICADSVEALIGLYLDKSGPLGALRFLKYLGLELGNGGKGDFLSLFNLSYDPVMRNDHRLDKAALSDLYDNLEAVQSIIGYTFRDPFYLLEAITHQSYTKDRATRSLGRLAFLGDALIDYLVSTFIFANNPGLNAGQLTAARSAIVCNDNLARIIIGTKISEHLLHNSGPLQQFTVCKSEYNRMQQSSESMTRMNPAGIGAASLCPKTFGDLMESIIGAVFIDSGLDLSRTWDVFRNLMTDEALFETLTRIPQNPIVTLHQMFPNQCRFGKARVQEDNLVSMTLYVADRCYTEVSTNQKEAKLALAKTALEELASGVGSIVN